jgi:hypothetical protein
MPGIQIHLFVVGHPVSIATHKREVIRLRRARLSEKVGQQGPILGELREKGLGNRFLVIGVLENHDQDFFEWIAVDARIA